MAESSLSTLKHAIVNVLRSDEMAAANAKEISQILKRLAAQEISAKQAEKELDEIAPGLGSRIINVIKERGLVAIPVLLSAFALYATFQANSIAREANDISRAALDLAIEQAADKSVSSEIPPSSMPGKHVPTKPSVQKASPHSTVHKNRKARRAEKAKKGRAK